MKSQRTRLNTILPIVKYGDPILRKIVDDITDFTDLPKMVDQMFDTMYDENGIAIRETIHSVMAA